MDVLVSSRVLNKLEKDIKRIMKEKRELNDRVKKLVAALIVVEHVYDGKGVLRCPVCGATNEEGHFKGCVLSEALNEVE